MAFETSNEMFINMKGVPKWDPKKSYFDQTPDALQFYSEEFKKIVDGVTIGGFKVHPWLYFHVNFFKTPIPDPVLEKDILLVPALDDNMLYITETYEEAKLRNLGMLLFGTRGFAKSTFLASLTHWTNLTKPGGTFSIVGGSAPDLTAITSLIGKSTTNINPAFYIPTLVRDTDKYIEFGYKEKDGFRMTHSEVLITNTDKGTEKESEKGAGPSPIGFIADEIGKWAVKGVLSSAIPSFFTQHGAKLVPVLSGCVCAGTKVWNNYGDLVNIEDLKHEDGIIGFNQELGEASKEEITYWQPPHEKHCYRITTKSGKVLECSEDHPILFRSRLETETINKKRIRKIYFKEAKDLQVGNHIMIIESVDIWSNKRLWEPRLLGWLVGDGTYGFDSTPKISNCDEDIVNCLLDKFDARVELEYKTKDGKDYKQLAVRGICKNLREVGIYGQTKRNKTLPPNLSSYCKEDVCEFIGGYFEADGYVSCDGKNNLIGISSINLHMISELQIVLQKLGIHGYLNKKEHKPTKLVPVASTSFVLTISSKRDVLKFQELIKFKVKDKQKKLNQIAENLSQGKEKISRDILGMRLEAIKSIESIGIKPIYNLTAGTTNTYVASGIITHNTAGNKVLSKDAKEILADPLAHSMLLMNWDRLDRMCPEEAITWEGHKKSTFATFVPAQMSYRLPVPKIQTNLGDYLGNKNSALKNIKIQKTDWVRASEYIKEKQASLKKEEDRNKNKMYFPTNPDHCFLTDSPNPFNAAGIDKHIRDLEEKGKIGKSIEIYRDGNKNKYEFSGKRRAEVSHPGGSVDAPIILHGDFPEFPPEKYTFISGLDDYKLDVSDTDSLGAFYILKRRNLSPDEPCETIAASYTSRPDRHTDFHRNVETMIEVWDAECLMESVDVSFKQYLELKNKVEQMLSPSLTFSNTAQKRNPRLQSTYGLYPTTGNNEYRLNLTVDYTREEHTVGMDDDGNKIIKYGFEFIDDIDLLKEMRDYKKGGNFDRLTAFSHALVQCRELDKKDIRPKSQKTGFSLEKFSEKVNPFKKMGAYTINSKLKRY